MSNKTQNQAVEGETIKPISDEDFEKICNNASDSALREKIRVPQTDDVSCMDFLKEPYPTALPDEKTMDLNVFIVSKQLITENEAVVAIMNALRLADPECYIGITPVIQKPVTQNQVVEGETITGVEEAAKAHADEFYTMGSFESLGEFHANDLWENRYYNFKEGAEWLANKLK